MSASTGANMYSAQNPPEKSSPHVVETDRKTALQPIAPPRLRHRTQRLKICIQVPNRSKVPPPRSYHLHGGTFLDFATILLGFRTRIGFTSFVVPRPKIGPQTGPAHAHLAYRPLTTTGITPSVDESLSVPASDAPFGASSAGGTTLSCYLSGKPHGFHPRSLRTGNPSAAAVETGKNTTSSPS